jgi:hypothetical protein
MDIGVSFTVDTMKTETKKMPIEVEVLVIYDNVEAGKKAKGLFDRLQRFLGSEYNLFLRLWNMAALQAPSLAQVALQTVEWPGVLVIAVDGNKPLPQFFKRWLGQCARRPHPAVGAIAVHIYGVPQAKHALSHPCMDLRQIAREAGMAFLSEGTQLADDALNHIHDEAGEAACMRLKLIG